MKRTIRHLLPCAALVCVVPLAAQCPTSWAAGESAAGVDGVTRCGTSWDPDGPGPATSRVVVGGVFRTAGSVLAASIAAWDPVTDSWSAFGGGIDGEVYAVAALPNGDLVVGGSFATAGGVAANNIARWDGAAWSPLGAGFDDAVLALLALPSGDVLAGGVFNQSGALTTTGIARWSGGSWSSIGAVARVDALDAAPNGDVVVGGEFATAGGVAAANIARWDGATWSAVGPGLSGAATRVYDLAVRPNGNIVVSAFLGAGTTGVAEWNGSSWAPLGVGGYSSPTDLLLLPNGDVVASGYFRSIGGVPADGLALWNGAAWTTIGNDYVAYALALALLPNGELVAVAGGLRAARWNGTSWQPLGVGISGGATTALELSNGDLVVGGNFTRIGGVPARGLARWDGAQWNEVGGGLTGIPFALAELPNGDLVVGGRLTAAGGTPVDMVARWDGGQWSPMGSPSEYISALAIGPGGVLVAGSPWAAFGLGQHVAQWNGNAWDPIPGAAYGDGQALLALSDGQLAIGNAFGGVSLWDGATVTNIGSLNARCLAELPDGSLVAGGTYFQPLLRWDGQSWTPIGLTNENVLAVTGLVDGDVLVAHAPGTPNLTVSPVTISRWDGTALTTVAETTQVIDLVTLDNGDALALGYFGAVQGTISAAIARLTTPCRPDVQPGGAGCSGATLTATLPWTGADWRADAAGLPDPGLAIAVTGLAQVNLPLANVFATALPGCTLHVQPDLVALLLPVAGDASFTLRLPDTPALAGVDFHHQMVALDAALTVTATDALTLTIGTF